MQSLLKQRIAKLKRLRAWLYLSVTAGWVGLVTYLPLDPGETRTSLSWKCALVVTLVAVGLFPAKSKPWMQSLCLYAAFILTLFVSPIDPVVTEKAADLIWPLLGAFIVLGLYLETRLNQLTRHSDLHFS